MPSRHHFKRPLQRHFFKEWREHVGLDQERAAERIGLSRTQLSKIENLKSPYSQRILERAADAYGCSPADIIMRNPGDPNAPWSLQDSLEKAPQPIQAQIRAVVETLLKTKG